jgi:hypothetical protein
MPKTYEPIATVTAGGSSAVVTFSSILATYTDLILVTNLQGAGSVGTFVTVNNDTSANYSRTNLSGTGSSATSTRSTNATKFDPTVNGYVTNFMKMNALIHFLNYANTTTYKTFLARSNNVEVGADATVGLWRSTAAIDRIDVTVGGSGNWASGSTFTLYGIKAA